MKIFCFEWYIILPLFSSHYLSREINLGRDNRLNSIPLPLGQREPGQRGPAHFNTKTIQHGRLCPRTFNGYIFHKLIPVNEVFSILPGIMTNKVCHHKHQMKGFFISILLGSLQCTHLCIKMKKVPKVRVAPFAQCAGICPSYWAKGATLRANLLGV